MQEKDLFTLIISSLTITYVVPMSFFARVIIILALLGCFFSCARREQALYQRSQPERFTRVIANSATAIDVSVPIADTSQAIYSDESPVVASASPAVELTINRAKSTWERSSTRHAVTPTLATEPVTYKSKSQARKAKLLTRLGDTPVQTSGLAIASLVCGILSFFVLAVLLGPLAIIFGGVALSKIRKNSEIKGRGMAVAGLVLGIVATVVIVIVLASR